MTNKEIIQAFVQRVFNEHRLDRVAEFMHEDYIQHNPNVGTGRDAFVKAFEAHFTRQPLFRMEIKHLIAEDNFVVVHAHATSGVDDAGAAVADIYRLRDGLLAEHWDVLQKVPETFVHANGMF